jgi:hypothetical protein
MNWFSQDSVNCPDCSGNLPGASSVSAGATLGRLFFSEWLSAGRFSALKIWHRQPHFEDVSETVKNNYFFGSVNETQKKTWSQCRHDLLLNQRLKMRDTELAMDSSDERLSNLGLGNLCRIVRSIDELLALFRPNRSADDDCFRLGGAFHRPCSSWSGLETYLAGFGAGFNVQ